jgi:Fe-S cluster biogenesis protein NfuA
LGLAFAGRKTYFRTIPKPEIAMFIQTEATPNPATLKFLPGKEVLRDGTADFRDAATASEASPLAARLFSIPGVTGVFFGYDFITVTKDGPDWQHLKPAILGAIMEHFMSGQPVMANAGSSHVEENGEEFYDKEDEEIVVTIKELLDTRVRPAVAQDGGDITFRGYEKGTVFLHMKGACAGCPSSTATLKHGIQNLLRHFVPEVEHVEQVA